MKPNRSSFSKVSDDSLLTGSLCYNERLEPEERSLTTEYADIFDSKDAAKFLGVTVATLHNLCSNGKVPYYKFGRRNRYRKDELRALLLAEPRGDRK